MKLAVAFTKGNKENFVFRRILLIQNSYVHIDVHIHVCLLFISFPLEITL